MDRNRTTQIAIAATLALALAGGGFFAGMTVARAQTPSNATAEAIAAARGGAGAGGVGARLGVGGAAGGQAVVGRVLSVNTDSITVEVRTANPGGAPLTSSTIVLVGANTRVVRTVEQDIKVGDIKAQDQVTIVGTTDATTGAVSAQAIVVGGNAFQQILGGGQRPGAGGQRPSPSPTGR